MLVGPAADQFDRINVLCCVVLCGCIPSLLMSLMVPSTKADLTTARFFILTAIPPMHLAESFHTARLASSTSSWREYALVQMPQGPLPFHDDEKSHPLHQARLQ